MKPLAYVKTNHQIKKNLQLTAACFLELDDELWLKYPLFRQTRKTVHDETVIFRPLKFERRLDEIRRARKKTSCSHMTAFLCLIGEMTPKGHSCLRLIGEQQPSRKSQQTYPK